MDPERTESPPASEEIPSRRYLPYPDSRLSPRIMPLDLTSHKSRGIDSVQRCFQARLGELHREYLELLDQFNWNKLIYEARYGFEPAVGQSYHLYRTAEGHALSMIEPERWPGKPWIGTFRLRVDGQWEAVAVAPEFDLREWVERNGAH